MGAAGIQMACLEELGGELGGGRVVGSPHRRRDVAHRLIVVVILQMALHLRSPSSRASAERVRHDGCVCVCVCTAPGAVVLPTLFVSVMASLSALPYTHGAGTRSARRAR